jgi:hypothetical protein
MVGMDAQWEPLENRPQQNSLYSKLSLSTLTTVANVAGPQSRSFFFSLHRKKFS